MQDNIVVELIYEDIIAAQSPLTLFDKASGSLQLQLGLFRRL